MFGWGKSKKKKAADEKARLEEPAQIAADRTESRSQPDVEAPIDAPSSQRDPQIDQVATAEQAKSIPEGTPSSATAVPEAATTNAETPATNVQEPATEPEKKGFFARFRSGAEKTDPNRVPETAPSTKEPSRQETSHVAEPQPAQNDVAVAPDTHLETAATVSEPKHEIKPNAEELAEEPSAQSPPVVAEQPQEKPEKKGVFARIKAGLQRTRSGLSDGLADLLLGKKEIDDDLLEDIETQLLMADIGVAATQDIVKDLTERTSRKELNDSDALFVALKQHLAQLLAPCTEPLVIDTQKTPYVILMVGVNGVGKTTTIGKMAKRFQEQGKSVVLAAGDTFRAAAVEQLQTWGERNNVPVVAQHTGADSASVIFDAVQSAQAKGTDIVIADTAGRLQNKGHLMQELEKVVRVMKKLDDSAPHEVMLVLDAGTGQNALNQARTFQQAVGVTSVSLSKLDGTAKGGIIFAIAKELELPVRFIGVGEKIDDLRPFDANEFIDALFAQD